MSSSFTLRDGDFLLSKNLSVASSKVSESTRAFELLFVSPKCSNETARAKNSPNESQRKWFSATNCCTCLGAEPPAPVSNKPPPFINGTIESILALVPNSKIGKRSVK